MSRWISVCQASLDARGDALHTVVVLQGVEPFLPAESALFNSAKTASRHSCGTIGFMNTCPASMSRAKRSALVMSRV